MAESGGKTLREARIVEVDSVVVSPSERASFINGVLAKHCPELTLWDKIAGFAELLAAFSVAEPALEDVAKTLVKRVYVIHYFHGRELKSCLKKLNLTETPKRVSSTPLENFELIEKSDQPS